MRLSIFNRLLLASLINIILLPKLYPAEITPPFTLEVNLENINLRADSTVSSPVICTVNKGDMLEVTSELYEWYKVKLPGNAPSYIRKDMVTCLDNACLNAKVSKSRVNIRLAPDEKSAILGTADNAEPLKILGEEGNWYRIEPTPDSRGWINKKFTRPIPDDRLIPAKTHPSGKTNEQPKAILSLEQKPILVIEGIIKPYGKFFKRPATHRLTDSEGKVFLLKGNKKELDSFNYRKAKVTGNDSALAGAKYPLIEIISLEERTD